MKDKIANLLTSEFNLSNHHVEQFNSYLTLLKEWNKKMNLTALEEDEEIIIKHFYDSLLCTKAWEDWHDKKLIDIGTGAGFPGIPLRIINNQLGVTLFDSLAKRLTFLDEVINTLNLDSICTLHGRAEDLGRNDLYREQFDIVTARAVAKLPILLELCLPFVKIDGVLIAMKGPEGLSELEDSKYALEILGGKTLTIKEFNLINKNHDRTIIIIKKVLPTPSKYPRKAGIPQKRMLCNPKVK